jgi:SET domain-containing protein
MKLKIEYKDDKTKGLFADQKFSKNNIILILSGHKFTEPTRTSVQVRDKHIEHHEGGYINHHCDPSAKIITIPDVEEAIIVAKRNILRGEEITFDYETTEEQMAVPFECNCHGKLISGWGPLASVFVQHYEQKELGF